MKPRARLSPAAQARSPIRAERQVRPLGPGGGDGLVEQEVGSVGPVAVDHVLHGIEPFTGLDRVQVVAVTHVRAPI
jgi:hypothetical protein